jgi:hypothetical protein
VRHPQYVGFVVIMIGFLLQWPTLATLLMFPVLVWFYVRLARREGSPRPKNSATPGRLTPKRLQRSFPNSADAMLASLDLPIMGTFRNG